MAIEPAVINLPTIYQNAAYSVQMRLTDRLRKATIADGGLISCPCHNLSANSKVVLLSKSPTANLCGAILNQIYYVSPVDLAHDTLRLSTASIGGAAINITGADEQEFYVAKPVDITGYVVDADICKKPSNLRVQVATFTTTIDAAIDGGFSLKLSPTDTISIAAGDYAYDVSMTPPNGDRFYPVQGNVCVAVTRSRA